jgi:hypothetical protein
VKSPLELIREADGMRMVDEDGNEDRLVLLPGLDDAELNALRAALPCPLPPHIEALVRHCRGLENGPLESVEFAGLPSGFGMEEIFPHAVPIGHDGYGNYWIVDLVSTSTEWGPIFYACHDPPVIAWQCDTLSEFLVELLRFANPPHRSALDVVHEEVTARVWRENAGAERVAVCRGSPDPAIRAFAESLDDTFMMVDLRRPTPGDGFSWGRYGPRTVNRRFGEERLFAYQRRTSLVRRILGSHLEGG